MDLPLLIYRFSGWLITIVEISLAIYILRSKNMWQGRYIFMSIYFCIGAFFEIVSSVTAILLINNLFLSNILSPLNFTLKALYLREISSNKLIRLGVIFIVIIFVSINVLNSLYLNKFKEINNVGIIINRGFFVIFSIWILTNMFRNNANSVLRQKPDFWFTATMFCFAFFGIISTVLIDVSYSAQSEIVLYVLFISENLINAALFYGYFKSVKLLR